MVEVGGTIGPVAGAGCRYRSRRVGVVEFVVDFAGKFDVFVRIGVGCRGCQIIQSLHCILLVYKI